MMVSIVWKLDDGKFRPGIGIPVPGRVYSVANHKAVSYVLQDMAEYPEVKSKVKKQSKKES